MAGMAGMDMGRRDLQSAAAGWRRADHLRLGARREPAGHSTDAFLLGTAISEGRHTVFGRAAPTSFMLFARVKLD